jgi:hypothetical protein
MVTESIRLTCPARAGPRLNLALDSRILLGVLLGLVAIGVGVFSVVTAILTRRRRSEIAETYAVTGGVAYSVVQFGCAAALILSGLVVIGIVVFAGRQVGH